MRFILVRHGDPDYVTDSLTEIGHDQAEKAAERLMCENITRIYSSSCGRAYQTAEHTANKLGLPITKLDFMREVGWGYDNSTREELSNHYQPWNMASKLSHEGVDLMHADPSLFEFWKGTRLEAGYKTVTEGLDSLLKEELGYRREGSMYRCMKPNEEVVAVFAHCGSGTCALSYLLNIPVLYFYSTIDLSYASVSTLSFSSHAGSLFHPGVRTINDHAHIKTIVPNRVC